MITIMSTALREKIRRKELYIIAVIGLLVILLITTGTGTITVDGVPVTAYQNVVPVLLVVTNVLCGALAIALGLRTIPNEYDRKTSHLIWMRGITQMCYHGALALANAVISMVSVAIMYVGIIIYALSKGEYAGAARSVPAFLLSCVGVVTVSLLTSALSICMPAMAAGCIAAAVYLVGIGHGLLDIYQGMVEGLASAILKILLFIVPDLNGLQNQAANLIKGEPLDIHLIFCGLLAIYLLTWLFVLLKKREA